MRCAACSFDNPEGMRFCGQCGAPLSGPAAAPEELAAKEAERRHLTVMFCDLVGSTELSHKLDPEDLREVIRSYQAAAGEVISGFEGHIAQYLGDGLLVYFGYPRAHEDDAQRAIHAGLGIIDRLRELNQSLQQDGVGLSVRLGVHTGLVVAGEMGAGGSREKLALGATPNIAARIEGLAEPNSLLLSAATHQLAGGAFDCEALGPKQLKGVAAAIEVYRAIRERGISLEGVTARGPMVGREDELAELLEVYQRSTKGEGQFVLVSAEAGLGKSRLVAQLHRTLRDNGQQWLFGRCSPYAESSALSPLIEMTGTLCGLRRREPAEDKLDKLAAKLESLGLSPPDVVPLVAELLSIPLDGRFAPLSLEPEKLKNDTFEALVEILLRLAAEGPLVTVIEDLHWVDPSTKEFLDLLFARIETAPVFMLLTARTSFDTSWNSGRMSSIRLQRLSEQQVGQMARSVAGDKALPPEVIQQIVAKTDGVPLFVEELTKTLLESEALSEGEDSYELVGEIANLDMPTTLQGSLTARLDRLGDVKGLALLAAVLGRSFSYEMLRAITPADEVKLRSALEALVDAEFLYARGVPPSASYSFKHALVQDAAYNILLKRDRQRYHQRLASTLPERFPDTVENQPELLAHHCTAAGMAGEALGYWLRAGRRAQTRSAHLEAIQHLEKGLALLPDIEETEERDRQEIDLHQALAHSIIATRGFALPEVQRSYFRALELCRKLDEKNSQFWVLLGLKQYEIVSGHLHDSLDLANQALELARQVDDPALRAAAEVERGTVYYFMGRFEEAIACASDALDLVPAEDMSFLLHTGWDLRVYAHGTIALCSWHLGHLRRSARRAALAIERARELDHAYSLTLALLWQGAQLAYMRRDGEATREFSREMLAVSEGRGFDLWDAHPKQLLAWARTVGSGRDRSSAPADYGESIQLAEQGLAFYRGSRSQLHLGFYLGVMAEVRVWQGLGEEAEAFLSEALTLVDATDDRSWEAELHRLRGLLALTEGGEESTGENSQEAARWFRKAVEIARQQGSRSLELRAALSLARLLHGGDEGSEAIEELKAAYAWFADAPDSADLAEVRQFLDSLAA